MHTYLIGTWRIHVSSLRYAVFGAGFWAQFQIAAWQEVGGVDLVAVYNRTRARAEATAQRFGIPRAYDDAEELLRNEQLDFMDIITEVPGHAPLVLLAAQYRIPVICQKPMAADWETARRMVRVCREAGIPLYIHENFRWQTAIRATKDLVAAGRIGEPFRARIQFVFRKPFSFDKQPFLRQVEHLALADLGSHLFDLARFFFGEPRTIYAETTRTRDDIAGEDVASAVLRFDSAICSCDISYSTHTEAEQFPQTLLYIEGKRGTVELAPGYWVRLTTDEGTFARRYPPAYTAWADPDFAVVHNSIVPCNAHLLGALRGEYPAESSGDDNLRTTRLVFQAYESAKLHQTIEVDSPAWQAD